MEKENILIQFLIAGISGGIIVLLVYLSKKIQNANINIKLGKKSGIILITILILISIFILII